MASQIRPVPNKPTAQPRIRGRFQASKTGNAGMKKCKRCNGKSTAAGYICPECNGTGQVARAPQNRFNSTLRKTSLKKVSGSLRAKLELYKDLRVEFLRDRPCEWPGGKFGHCFKMAYDVHHVERRGKNLLNVKTWKGLCREHHTFCHENPREARQMGLLK